ncbi:hypothetical protein [Achromobacter aegrifaciens]|uniref:hypothetical protein n=1 Tax=Achromobacter aegrifaciens TaxID=1287736 RepID=UPI00141991A1|nr:hypothetical protein [Achromobacter aegrifaciens]
MHKPAPLTFGARLATHPITKEQIAWFFSVPVEQPSDNAPPAVPVDDDKIQIGPLDV